MIIIAIILLICIIALNKNNNNKITQKSLAEEEQKLINLDIEIKEETEDIYKCLLTFTSTDETEKIKTIEYPTEEGKKPQVITVASAEGKEKIGIDYEIKKGDEDKTFKIETTNGNRFDERTGYNVTYMNDDEIFTTRTRLKTQILPITNLSPKQDGKQFIGYSEDRNATVPDYFENGNAKRDKDTTLYAIYIEEKNGYTEDVNNESLIGKVSKINTSGVQNITVNGITYSANVIVENKDIVLDGEEQIQGATLENKIYEFGDNSQDVATANEYAKNMVILKVNGNLTINSNVTLTACKSPNGYGGPKGLLIYCTGTLSNNGRIDMTARGAWAEGQDVYLWQNADGNYEYVPAEGAEGGEGSYAYSTGGSSSSKKYDYGKTGKDGIKRQTGGGGSGGAIAIANDTKSYSGAGATGTSYSGGTGGGGAEDYALNKTSVALAGRSIWRKRRKGQMF